MKNRFQVLALALATLQNALTNAGITVNKPVTQDTTMYLTFDAKGKGSINQLVDSNTKKLEGTTNFDGNKLDADRYLVIDGVRGLYEDTQVTVGAAKWDSATVAAVRNSELSIIQGTEILRLPATDIFNIHRANAKSSEDDFREISHLPIIMPDKAFNIVWTFPNGVVVDPAVTAALIRLEFRCTQVFNGK